MKTRLLRRASAGALAITLLSSIPSTADVVEADGDGLTPLAAGSLALGNVCVGQTVEKSVLVAISRNGNYGSTNVFKAGSTVTVTVLGVTSGLGLSASVSAPGTITIPLTWGTASNNTMSPSVTSPVTFVAGPSERTLPANTTIKYVATGVDVDNKALTRDGSLSVTGSVVSCNTPPQITVNDVTLEGNTLGGRSLSFANIGSATDAEDATPPPVTCSPSLGSVLPLGITTVTCTATDSGNVTASDSGQVTIVDTVAPTVADVPSSQTVEASSASGATVTYASPTASDVVWGTVGVTCAPASGTTFPLGANTVICTAADGSNNAATAAFVVNVHDTIAPEISVANVTVEGNTLGGANVTFPLATATDAVDGNRDVTCGRESGDFFELGTTTVNCTSSDSQGNTSEAAFVVTVVDTTAPVISVSDVTVEGNTTNGADVDFTTPTATDIVDGQVPVGCDFDPGDLFPLGGTTVTCSSSDASGNAATATFSVAVEDTTAPTLNDMPSDVTVEGNTFGGAYHAYTDPTATDIVDPNPGVTCLPSSAFFGLGATTVTCTATDASSNSTSDSFVVTVVDTTAPVIADQGRNPVPNANGWNNTDVTVSWTCTDTVSDVVSVTVSDTVTTEGRNQSAMGTCEDTSGNTASAAVNGISIDKTDPSVGLAGGPAAGGSYYFGSVPTAPTCEAHDELSGIDGSCVIDGYSTAIGSHTVTATARDVAGNEQSDAHSYDVRAWTLNGFYQPVDMGANVWNTVKNGSTVPLKFEAFAGSELTDVAVVDSFTVKGVACPITGVTTDDIELVTTGGTALRYDWTAGQFVQNWQTPKKPGVCYTVTMKTDDGSAISANFKLK